MVVGKHLLHILRCPESRGELYFFDADSVEGMSEPFLFCPESRLRYRIDNGIPVMLVDDATRLDEEESQALVDRAKELGLTLSSN